MTATHELIYPIAQWSVTEDQLNVPLVPGDETVFALANGYMGIRGTFEEQSIGYAPGSFINGYYETEPIVYGESAYGFELPRVSRRPLQALRQLMNLRKDLKITGHDFVQSSIRRS